MELTQMEQEKLLLHYAGKLAQERLIRGIRLNEREALSYISMELQEMARAGKPVVELVDEGTQLLSAEDVMDGVPEKLEKIQLEAEFPDGIKLVIVPQPIRASVF